MAEHPSTPPARSRSPLEVVQRARDRGIDSIIVGVSGGRDSVATLSVCRQAFSRVEAFFMYVVPDLDFQERYLGYLERRFEISILRIPHWAASQTYRTGVLRHATQQSRKSPRLNMADIDAYVRQQFGIEWIATGEKANDSLERGAQIKRCQGINDERRRLYPLAWWTHSQVESHLARNQIMLPPDYRLRPPGTHRGQFGCLLSFDEIEPIRRTYPSDYEKIRRMFPLIESQLERARMLAERRPDILHVKTTPEARKRAAEERERRRQGIQSGEQGSEPASQREGGSAIADQIAQSGEAGSVADA